MSDKLDRREVREAILLLREEGVTPEEYATVTYTEEWRVGGEMFPDREAAFAAAGEVANRSGEWAEVSRGWVRSDGEGAWESWIVEPGGEVSP